MSEGRDDMRGQTIERVKVSLSAVLRAEIERQGITVYALAKRACLNDQTVRDIMCGRTMPKLDAVLSIEEGLHKPPGWVSQAIYQQMVEDVRSEMAEMEAAAEAEKKQKKKPK